MRSRSTGIIVRDDSVLLMRRNKDGFEYFVFPGGGVEEGETPTEALHREMAEEVGIQVLDQVLLCEGQNDSSRGTDLRPLDQYEYMFLITRFNGEPEYLESGSDKNVPGNTTSMEWFDIDEVKSLQALYPKVAGFDIFAELKKRGVQA